MVLLGQRYEMGDVVQQDLNLAGKLYSAASKERDVTGVYHLALLYLNGIGTKADPVRAFVLLSNARNYQKADELYLELEKSLTPEQLEEAKTRLASSND